MKHCANSHLIVNVMDHTYQQCKSATVKIKQTNTKSWRELIFCKEAETYSLKDLPQGTYDMSVEGNKGWLPDVREIILSAGVNSITSSVAPRGTAFYSAADGEKVFFEQDNNRLLVFAFGQDAQHCAAEACKEHNITYTVSDLELREELSEEMRKTRSHFYIDLPKEASKREALIKQIFGVVGTLERKYNITAHITQPALKKGLDVEGLLNELIVKFEAQVTDVEAREIAKRHGYNITRTIPYLGNAYVLRYKKYAPYEMIQSALALKDKLPIIWAEPNRIVHHTHDAFTPNDFLYAEQPHYPLINANNAWDTLDDINVNIRSGSASLTIAVFDVNGVSPTHPDLTGNLTDGTAKMVANFDFANWQNQTVANLGGDHGTQCASSATARFNNNSGAVGLAGNCHLIGASLGQTLLDQADAWIWSAGFATGNTNAAFPGPVTNPADVITNSWGANGAALSSTYKDAFDFLTTYGRNGRGCVVCFSLGNNGYIDFTTHATRRRMYAAYEKTIAVGASVNSNPTSPVSTLFNDHNGNSNNLNVVVDTRTTYSPYGPAVDIVAPSHTCYAAVSGNVVDPILSAVRVNQGDLPADDVSATTLANAAAAGDNTLTLVSAAGFSVGEFLVVNTPGSANREYHGISAIAANVVTLDANLNNAHAAGTSVSTGPNNYSFDFGGTSHACPTVAGAAALMLSVKPELNWVQVRQLLRDSAVIIDAAQANAIGQWTDTDGDTVNDFSQWYGYGRLDVDAAVIATRDLGNVPEVVMRDNLADIGAVPSTGWHAHSPDIWVRQTDDPIPALGYASAPPHQNAKRGQDNYVYLRVKNFGAAAAQERYLRALICHFPGFEFRYPTEWQPSNRPGQAVPNPLVQGTYLIGEQRVDTLAAAASTIVKITWPQALIPPSTVMVGGVNVNWHPCILAEVSPHDGILPSSSGHAVKDYNDLAHRNISIDDAGGDSAADDFAVGVVAGTSDQGGIKSIIIDKEDLPDNYTVFAFSDDDKLMARWLEAVRGGKIVTTKPLPGIESAELPNRSCKVSNPCGVTLLEPTKLSVECRDGSTIIIHAPEKTVISSHCSKDGSGTKGNAEVSIGQYEGREVIVFKGSASAIELPYALASNEYSALALGIFRPAGSRRQGYLKVTQCKANGELSAGFTIQG